MTVILFDLAGADPAHRFSPYCWRVRLALAHKNVPYETRIWRLHEKSALGALGHDKVPVLIDGDQVIGNSARIARHLEASRPGAPSLFGDRATSALSDFIIGWTDTIFHPQIARSIIADVWRHLDPEDQPYFRQTREARFGQPLEAVIADREARLPAIRQSLDPVRRVLECHPYLAGDTPLYVDYSVFSIFQWVRTVSGFTLLTQDDPITPWVGRMLDLYGGLARHTPCPR